MTAAPTFRVGVSGLSEGDRALRTFAAGVQDWRPFWLELGEHLADDHPIALAATPTVPARLRKSLDVGG